VAGYAAAPTGARRIASCDLSWPEYQQELAEIAENKNLPAPLLYSDLDISDQSSDWTDGSGILWFGSFRRVSRKALTIL
jgi:hypothetical protein